MEAKTAEKIMLASSIVIFAAIPTVAFINGFKKGKAAVIAKNRKSKTSTDPADLANNLFA